MPAPKKNAVLLTGPPISKAIIPPSIMASSTLFPVLMVSSHEMSNRNAEYFQNDEANDCGRNNRNYQDGHNRAQIFGDRNLFDQLDQITGKKSDDYGAQKTCLHFTAKISSNESWNQSWLAGNRIGNITGEYGQHQRE